MFNSSIHRGRNTGPKRHVDRREERVEKVKSGSICVDGGDQVFACTVRDIHSSGARMSIVDAQHIADSFLLIVRSNNLVARCKVAWRKPNEVGVRFLRVGDLNQEERMRAEQQSAHQMELRQISQKQEDERLRVEQDRQHRENMQAQRRAQIHAARMQIMGLDPAQPYTADDLKSAYRRQAMNKHPDQGGDPLEFQQLTEIYNLMAQALQSNSNAA